MYRSVVVLMGLAVSVMLAGCSSSTSITVQAGTNPSMTKNIQATFQIGTEGRYHYELTFARMPPQPGAQPQTCLPVTLFDFVDSSGGLEDGIDPPVNQTGAVSGSFYFTTGTWTGRSRAPGISFGGALAGANPPGTFYGGACPWSLTLTPSN
jgi:hypothetical protein